MVYLLSALLQQESVWAFPSTATFCTKPFSSTWRQPQNVPKFIRFEPYIPECWNSLKTLSLYEVTTAIFFCFVLLLFSPSLKQITSINPFTFYMPWYFKEGKWTLKILRKVCRLILTVVGLKSSLWIGKLSNKCRAK